MELSAQFQAQTALTRQNSSGSHRINGLFDLTAGMDLSLIVQPVDSHYTRVGPKVYGRAKWKMLQGVYSAILQFANGFVATYNWEGVVNELRRHSLIYHRRHCGNDCIL